MNNNDNNATITEKIATGIGRIVGRMLRNHREAKSSRNNGPQVVLWTPDCQQPGALRADILVSMGRRFAVIDTGAAGLKSIPVSAVCSVR